MSKTLLIIEDDVVTRDLLRLVFEYDGFTLYSSRKWSGGINLVGRDETFDVIILDNVMPKMTGLEFLDHHRRSSQTPEFDSYHYDHRTVLNEDIREQATKLGVYAIIGKPYDLGELRALVNQLSTTIPSDHPLMNQPLCRRNLHIPIHTMAKTSPHFRKNCFNKSFPSSSNFCNS